MTLYTHKKGQYVPLTREQLHKLQRRDHVIDLQRQAVLMCNAAVAIVEWLAKVEQQHNVVTPRDIALASLPSRTYLLGRIQHTKKAVQRMQKGDNGRNT